VGEEEQQIMFAQCKFCDSYDVDDITDNMGKTRRTCRYCGHSHIITDKEKSEAYS